MFVRGKRTGKKYYHTYWCVEAHHHSTAFHIFLLIFDRLNKRRMRQEMPAYYLTTVPSRERKDQRKKSVKSWIGFASTPLIHLGLCGNELDLP